MTLSAKAKQAIKENGELYGKIADQLGIKPLTMPDKLRKKHDADFTQAGVINLIKEYTGLSDSEILTEEEKQPAPIN
jgi:hypothetical protein